MKFKKVKINPFGTILLFLFSIALIVVVLNRTEGSDSVFSVVIPILSGVLFGRSLQLLVGRFNSYYKFTDNSLFIKIPFNSNLEFLYQNIEIKGINPFSQTIEVIINNDNKREFVLSPVEFEKFYKELEKRIHEANSTLY